jgi:PAS domain S-box-containing protein
MATPVTFLSRRRSHPATVRSHLVKLVLIALAPLLIFSAWIIVLFSQQERAIVERGIAETARALAFVVDREFESSITTLQTLATSEHLDAGNVTDLQRACARILQAQNNWRAINLLDPSGRLLFNIAKPPGMSRPGTVEAESLNQALQTGRPAISNLMVTASGGAIVNVHVPVWREDKVKYVVSVEIEPQVFKEILTRQKFSPDWLATIYDRKKTVVADTRDQERFVGKSGGPLSEKLGPESIQGLLEGVSREGIASYAAFQRSLLSGWSVMLAVPTSTIGVPLPRSLITVAGAGVVFSLVGFLFAAIFARRITVPIEKLSSAAHALGKGETVPTSGPVKVAELDALTRNIEHAAELLRERLDERDRVEAALRDREEFLQRHVDLLDLSADAIFAWQFDGAIIYWNQGAEQLYGYARTEAIGRVSHDLLSTVFPETRDDFEATLVHGGEWTVELMRATRDGRHVLVESHLRMIKDRTGRSLVLECNRDITSRKRAMQRLSTEHTVTRTLAECETQAEATGKILDTIGRGLGWEFGALWLVDRETNALRCLDVWHMPSKSYPEFEASCRQRTFSSGVGLPGRVWASKEPLWVPDVVKDSNFPGAPIAAKENLHGAFAFPIMVGREVLGVTEFFNHEIREPDLDLINMTVIIGNELGQFIERERAEAALRESEQRLREQAQELEQQLIASGRLVSLGELTASMAHEFNNPLGTILGFVQDMLSDVDASDPNRRSLQIIEEETKRCEKIVQDLLEFARPRNADFISTDVNEVIKKTVEMVSSRLFKQKVEAISEAEPELPQIHADPQQLQQVLANLCLNALDAMPGGGKLTLGAKANSSNQMAISVADTGFGMDADTLSKIFQPFFTVRKRKGMGLGLPICERIVKSHGGTIEVESEPGQGTRFIIQLPITKTADRDQKRQDVSTTVDGPTL